MERKISFYIYTQPWVSEFHENFRDYHIWVRKRGKERHLPLHVFVFQYKVMAFSSII